MTARMQQQQPQQWGAATLARACQMWFRGYTLSAWLQQGQGSGRLWCSCWRSWLRWSKGSQSGLPASSLC